MARKTAKQGHINRDEGMFKRLSLLLLCVAAGLTPAQAADYPAHAIKMVVPFAPGGGTDVLGRIIAQRLQEQWGQPVVIENQPGASGGIGTRAAAKAEPDGYTLLMASTGALMAASAALSPDGAFDVNKFFAPITMVAAPPYLVAINPNVPAKSTAELIALARAKPKSLSFGSSGIGTARICRAWVPYDVVELLNALQGHRAGRSPISWAKYRHDVLALDHGAGAARRRQAQGAGGD